VKKVDKLKVQPYVCLQLVDRVHWLVLRAVMWSDECLWSTSTCWSVDSQPCLDHCLPASVCFIAWYECFIASGAW